MMKCRVRSLSRASLSAIAAALFLAAPMGAAVARGTDAYIGQICITAAPYCAENAKEANGQTLQISEDVKLYALMGCTFGGDCRNTIGLPDLRGRRRSTMARGSDSPRTRLASITVRSR